MIAVSANLQEIRAHWDYLEKNVLPVLGSFESEEEARQYVLSKVEGEYFLGFLLTKSYFELLKCCN